jgi:hypothetical protein
VLSVNDRCILPGRERLLAVSSPLEGDVGSADKTAPGLVPGVFFVRYASLRGGEAAGAISATDHAQVKRDCFAEFTLALVEDETRGSQ